MNNELDRKPDGAFWQGGGPAEVAVMLVRNGHITGQTIMVNGRLVYELSKVSV